MRQPGGVALPMLHGVERSKNVQMLEKQDLVTYDSLNMNRQKS